MRKESLLYAGCLVAGFVLHALILSHGIRDGVTGWAGAKSLSAIDPESATDVGAGAIAPLKRRDSETSNLRLQDVTPVAEGDYIYGDATAKTTIVSYLDFKCPFCQQFEPTLKQLVDDSAGQINLVFRLYPLQMGGISEQLATYAHCVGAVGGSEAFYKFSRQAFSIPANEEVAKNVTPILKNLAIQQDAVQSCVATALPEQLLTATLAEVDRVGIAGTPTTVIMNNETGRRDVLLGITDSESMSRRVASLL